MSTELAAEDPRHSAIGDRSAAQAAEQAAKPKKSFFSKLGPGLITGASDDDPSGIATYSQAGAAFGFGLLWSLLLTYPLMVAIQEISARIGRVTGRGIAGNIRRYYSPWLLYPVVLLLVVANTINLGADIGAMGAAVQLLVGGPALFYAAGFRRTVRVPSNLRFLSKMFEGAEVAHAGAVHLRPDDLRREGALGRSDQGHAAAEAV